MNRKLTWAWVLAVPLVTGCATMHKETFIKEQAGDYVYEMPADQVWPHVGAMLKEQGYSYREAEGRFLLVTEWKEENGSSSTGASFSRYMAEGQPIDDTHCRVRFVRNTMRSKPAAAGAEVIGQGTVRQDIELTSAERHAAQTTAAMRGTQGRAGTAAASARDLQAEWLLMQRVAPEDAKELQDEADARFK